MTAHPKGLLISVDGPGGVGKTTTVEHLAALLTDAGQLVHRTAQPSTGPIGVLARELVPTAGGAVLACLFAADRYHHLDSEIRPRLTGGHIVLCDRYLASGLVVQRADGLDLAFLAAVNAHADPPDLAVILTADPATIARRLTERGVHNRYQGAAVHAAAENAHYDQAATHLDHSGVAVLHIDTTHNPPDHVAAMIAAQLGSVPGATRTATATAATLGWAAS
jgi:dTMP kinase